MTSNQSIVQCPWCKTNYTSPTSTNCANCGGTLEYQLDLKQVGPRPADAPRVLPPKFIKRIKYSGNVMTIIGLVFMIAFCWTIIFPIIGYFIWKKGKKEAQDELIPLEFGTPTLGEVVAVRTDYSKVINGRSPMVVDFKFELNGRWCGGSVGNIFTDLYLLKQPGEQVWVVYMPQNPELSSIWPPLK